MTEQIVPGVLGKHGFVKEMNYYYLLELVDSDLRMKVNTLAFEEGTTGLVMYEVLDMSSSQLGRRTFMVYGPSHTYKTIEDAVQGHLGDLPSQRAYPKAYAVTPR